MCIPLSFVYCNMLAEELKTIYSWKTLEFLYDDPEQEQNDIAAGKYSKDNVILVDADCFQDTYFVTTPPVFSGIPATLSTVSSQPDSNGSYKLKPFPNWAWQNRSNCDNIISVERIKVDKLGRLWVVDNGLTNNLNELNTIAVCPAKLLVFDLNNNNTLIKRYTFPNSQTTSVSVLEYIEVQINDEAGQDTIAYIAVPRGYTMIVYNFKEDKSVVVMHPYFLADQEYGFFTVNGTNFTLTLGLFSLALDMNTDTMYFHALVSGAQSSVSAALLRKGNLTESERRQFKRFPCTIKLHTACEVLKNNTLIFSTLEDNSIHAWNINTPYNENNFQLLVRDDVRLQSAYSLKILQEQELLVASDRFQNVLAYGQNEKGATNFRILRMPLHKL